MGVIYSVRAACGKRIGGRYVCAARRFDNASSYRGKSLVAASFKESGQMTVELAVVFPVLLIVAVIAVNALLFFSECAAFDNTFRDAVRVHATSPAYGQTAAQGCSQVELALSEAFSQPYENSRVSLEGTAGGHTRFSATLEFYPTLFGLGLRSSVLGVALPPLSHTVSHTVDCYKPGVLL